MKKLTLSSLFLAFIGINIANAQVGIGTVDPHTSSILDVKSSTKGFLPPRMDSAARDAITDPTPGLTIFNTQVDCMQWFTAAGWWDICSNALISNAPVAGEVSDCPFVPAYLTAANTTITEITSPTGKIWMDRNLGAYTAARQQDDCWAYGNLYQWGRNNDGHEYRLSNQVTGQVAAGSEGADFRIIGANADWLITSDDSRWGNPADTDKGIHDPCPDGYRVPSVVELTAESSHFSTLNIAGAFGSALKLPATGARSRSTGSIGNIGAEGSYWTSTVVGATAEYFRLQNISASFSSRDRSIGYSVRCIKIASN